MAGPRSRQFPPSNPGTIVLALLSLLALLASFVPPAHASLPPGSDASAIADSLAPAKSVIYAYDSIAHIGEGRLYVYQDALGSTANLTTSAGTIQATYRLDAWGSVRKQLGGSYNARLFTGKERDAETGLLYFGARYYDPEMGRFLTEDPYWGDIGAPPSLNRYLYAYGNPARYIDRDGYEATEIGALAGYFWGFGQMVGGMINDLISGNVRGTGDYLSVWGQNIIAGAEIGLSIDATVLTGGTGWVVSGALGATGLEALTFGGEAKSWSEFAEDQAKHGVLGGVTGGVLSKAAPYVSKVAAEVAKRAPWLTEGASAVGGAVKEAVSKVRGQFIAAEGEGLFVQARNPFESRVVQEAGQKAAEVVERAIAYFARTEGRIGAEALPQSLGAADGLSLAVRNQRIIDTIVPEITSGGRSGAWGAESQTAVLAPYWPPNRGFLGQSQREFLMPGDRIDRYGGSSFSRFFSPVGTTRKARALPPGTADQPLRTFVVVKPFEVETGTVAPAFGELGLGAQYMTPARLEILLKRGIIREIK